jgi:hypothetical protein
MNGSGESAGNCAHFRGETCSGDLLQRSVSNGDVVDLRRRHEPRQEIHETVAAYFFLAVYLLLTFCPISANTCSAGWTNGPFGSRSMYFS